jgi:hypothetical protein
MVEAGLHARRVTLRAAAIAALCFLAAGAIFVFFVRTAPGQQLDASSFGAVTDTRSLIGPWSGRVRVGLLALSGALVVVLIIVALSRRRFRDVLVAALICVVTIALSLSLKNLVLTRPDLGHFAYPYNTFPSDHQAITTAALISSYLLLPGALRRPPALLALVAVDAISGLFQVVSLAHRPSDEMAGALLAGGVSALFLSRSGSLAKGWRRSLRIFAAVAAAGAIFCGVAWQGSGYAPSAHWIGVLAIALASAATATAALTIGADVQPWSARTTDAPN